MSPTEHCDMYLQDYVLDKSRIPDPAQWHEQAKLYANRLPMVSVFCCMWQRVHLNFFLYLSGMRYLHWKAPYNPIVHRDLHPLSGTSTIVTSLHAYTCTCSTFCPGIRFGQPSWAACIHVSSILFSFSSAAFACVCVCVHTCVRACVCACMRAHVCACVYARVHVRVHACMHACVCVIVSQPP